MQNRMMQAAIADQINQNIEIPRPGDTVNLKFVISNENNKERLQEFEGIVITVKGNGIAKNVTIRKISKGVRDSSVEKTFPIHSPLTRELKIINKSKVRRSRIFYLRDLTQKKIKTKLKISK